MEVGSGVMPRCDFHDKVTDGQEWLPVRLAAAQGIDLQSARERVEFAADEAVGPVAGGADSLLEKSYGSEAVGATQEDNASGGEVARRNKRARQPQWCGLDALKMTQTMGRDEAAGLATHLGGANKMVAAPDLRLPKMIEAFDLGLEAGLTRRREDRDHAETKAEMNDPTEFAGGSMGTLEAGVVVELDVTGPTTFLPMLGQDCEYICRAPRFGRPRLGEAPVEGDGIKNIHCGTIGNDQAFNKIEAVEFGTTMSQFRQIPAWRRWHLSLPSAIREQSMAMEDPLDCTRARR
jgi:hypothetical protein